MGHSMPKLFRGESMELVGGAGRRQLGEGGLGASALEVPDLQAQDIGKAEWV